MDNETEKVIIDLINDKNNKLNPLNIGGNLLEIKTKQYKIIECVEKNLTQQEILCGLDDTQYKYIDEDLKNIDIKLFKIKIEDEITNRLKANDGRYNISIRALESINKKLVKIEDILKIQKYDMVFMGKFGSEKLLL
ncbi:hypothetical protein [Clostridium estertheticum]|uniref:Uncharacterized protein n=1 Tax=Clostridium estertheticum TaxID=238834 RepID=A0AA47I444_9CLOT|nr:hypothetical protein [Clostridium estertheticum]MBU3155003.1 hypothetical protein [Clostridium estertheticum]WAG58822.1 hypothetical protein LL038_14285 [Clostridium estertheticum]